MAMLKMNWRLWRRAILIICIGMAQVGWPAQRHAAASDINCDVQSGVCTRQLDGRDITLEVLPRPVKAMEDLTFIVHIDGQAPARAPYIDLNMPAMDMGKNRVPLTLTAQGAYQGKGVIVRCRSGHRTWRARVTIPGAGVVDFIFDVIY